MRRKLFTTILRASLIILLLSLSLLSEPTIVRAESIANDQVIFLPQVIGNFVNVDGMAPPVCLLNEQETAMATLFQTDPEQERRGLRCDPILAAIARARAEDMAHRHYFDHINPDGLGPNALVRAGGYSLPEEYDTSRTANNIESIGAGTASAVAVWSVWLQSDHHRVHLLGQDRFYREQTDFGIGFASVPGSDYIQYWVVISVKPVS